MGVLLWCPSAPLVSWGATFCEGLPELDDTADVVVQLSALEQYQEVAAPRHLWHGWGISLWHGQDVLSLGQL